MGELTVAADTMPGILYAAVSNNSVVMSDVKVAEPSTPWKGDLRSLTLSMTKKLEGPRDNERQFFDFQGFSFTVVTRRGITFSCCADIEFGPARSFAFLDDIAARFEAEYFGTTTSSWQLAGFNDVMMGRARFFSGDPTSQRWWVGSERGAEVYDKFRT